MKRWIVLFLLVLVLGVGSETGGQIPSSGRDQRGLEGKNQELLKEARDRDVREEILPPPSQEGYDGMDEKTFHFSGIEDLPSPIDPFPLGTDLSSRDEDTLPPEINHQPPPHLENGTFLSTFVTDPSGIEVVFLHYRSPGEERFETFKMERMDGDRYEFVLGEGLFMEEGLEYYFTAFDSFQNGPAYWRDSRSPFLLSPSEKEIQGSKNKKWLFLSGFLSVLTVFFIVKKSRHQP